MKASEGQWAFEKFVPTSSRGSKSPDTSDGPANKLPLLDGGKAVGKPATLDWGPIGGKDEATKDYQTALWAAAELEKEFDKPFFIAVGLSKPHLPWFVPQKYFDMYPLEEVEVPRFRADDLDDIKLPGLTKAGKRCHRLVNLMDLYPTLIDLCGLSRKSDIAGRSIKELLAKPDMKWDYPTLTTYQKGNHAIRGTGTSRQSWRGGFRNTMPKTVRAIQLRRNNLRCSVDASGWNEAQPHGSAGHTIPAYRVPFTDPRLVPQVSRRCQLFGPVFAQERVSSRL